MTLRIPVLVSQVKVNDLIVQYYGEHSDQDDPDEYRAVEFEYEVHFPSNECSVTFLYSPFDTDEDGRIVADVDVRAGGDCIGMKDVLKCIEIAWAVHEQSDVAKRFRETER